MIPSGMQVFVALTAIDMRFSFDRLAGTAKEQIGYDARGGALFVFFGKRRNAVKVLFFDGTGMCVFHKRLDLAFRSHLVRFSARTRSTSTPMPSSTVKPRHHLGEHARQRGPSAPSYANRLRHANGIVSTH